MTKILGAATRTIVTTLIGLKAAWEWNGNCIDGRAEQGIRVVEVREHSLVQINMLDGTVFETESETGD